MTLSRRQYNRARSASRAIATGMEIGKSYASMWDSGSTPFFSLGSNWNNTTAWEQPTRIMLDLMAKSHPIVRACIYEIATTIAEPQLRIGREVDGEFVENENDEHIALLEYPNLDHTGNQLIQFIAASLAVHGIAYIQKYRGAMNTGRVTGLYYWPACWVAEQTTVEGSYGPVDGYNVNGHAGIVAPEDMIRIWIPSVDHPWKPSSPLASAYNDIRMDQESANYHAEIINNLAACGIAINVGQRVTPDQKRDAELSIASKFGRSNRGKPYVYGGDGADVKMISPLSDLDWPGVSSACETRICAALGVPPIIIGARAGLDRATYSNYELALKSYYSETARPLWVAIADALTRSLLRAEGITDLEFRFEYDSLPAMQESADSLSTRVLAEKAGGIITVNEARTAIGMDPLGPEHDEIAKQTVPPFGNAAQEDDKANR